MTEPPDSNVHRAVRELAAADSHRIPVRGWTPAVRTPHAIVQLLHGLAEHSQRYDRFALHCAARGFVVTAHDHRGHGAAAGKPGHFADRDGWDKVLADARIVHDSVRRDYPGLPLVLLGHSMGSYLAQDFVMRDPDSVDALLLSGSTWPPRLQVRAGRLLAQFEIWRHGSRYTSPLLDRIGFGAFNRRFEPARTAFDWLSRDDTEVDRYENDPLCGRPSTAALWRDLLGGLLAISTTNALRRVPAALPILVTGGEQDPVGGRSGMTRLAAAYEASGHTRVEQRIYDGGRHEMLNETNRGEVTAAILHWMAAALDDAGPGLHEA